MRHFKIGKFQYDTNTYNPFITNFRLTINCFPCIIVIDQVSDNAYEVKIAKDDGWIGGIYKDSWEYIFEIPKLNYEEFEKGLKSKRSIGTEVFAGAELVLTVSGFSDKEMKSKSKSIDVLQF
jgi:hypothetical protein